MKKQHVRNSLFTSVSYTDDAAITQNRNVAKNKLFQHKRKYLNYVSLLLIFGDNTKWEVVAWASGKQYQSSEVYTVLITA